MNVIQKILKAIYPVRMKISEATGLGKNTLSNKDMKTAPVSFYSLKENLNNGKSFSFETLKGKYVLLVNTASNCGFTGQYDELEKLWQEHKDHLTILGFPSNDFGGQEPGSDDAIAEFCRVNYGVSFPLFQKGAVKGADIQPVFQWLSDPHKNGWNSTVPSWNFCKYLVGPDGLMVDFYSSAVSPLSNDVTKHFSKV